MSNFLVITGNLTKDPELRYTPTGKAVATITIADGKDNPVFVDIDVWDKMAENLAETMSKGDRAIAVCFTKLEQWEDKQGNKRQKLKFTARAVGPDLRWASAQITKNPKEV